MSCPGGIAFCPHLIDLWVYTAVHLDHIQLSVVYGYIKVYVVTTQIFVVYLTIQCPPHTVLVSYIIECGMCRVNQNYVVELDLDA